MSTSLLPGANEPDINKGPAILRACSTVTLLAFFSVCARIFVRVRMVHSTGPDVRVLPNHLVFILTAVRTMLFFSQWFENSQYCSCIIPDITTGALLNRDGHHYSRGDERGRPPFCIPGSRQSNSRPEAQFYNSANLPLGDHRGQNLHCSFPVADCTE